MVEGKLRMTFEPINLKNKLEKFNEYWSPRVVAEMNDYQLKLVKVSGEFVWHSHADTDEVFIVIDGKLTIEFRDGQVDLNTGEMFVIPQGKEHRPVAGSECHIMIIEPKGVVNTGDESGELTAPNDLWV
jgi:mannose-6-phosphate isomerase-like protein (cupin superfamily)